jgi:hypothetical protein
MRRRLAGKTSEKHGSTELEAIRGTRREDHGPMARPRPTGLSAVPANWRRGRPRHRRRHSRSHNQIHFGTLHTSPVSCRLQSLNRTRVPVSPDQSHGFEGVERRWSSALVVSSHPATFRDPGTAKANGEGMTSPNYRCPDETEIS